MASGGGVTPEQRAATAAQAEELKRLKGIEGKKIAAAGRRRRGRASLISGAEAGLSDTLG